MTDPKTILLRILDIIGYSEDKDKFATEFLQNVSLQALLDLFNTLPQDKKDQLQQKIVSVGNDTAKIQVELKVYFTPSQMEQAIEGSAKNAVTEYVKAIDPTLSETQRTNIANFAKGLNQNNLLVQSTV